MGFVVGCYSMSSSTEATDRAIAAMAGFYTELGFNQARLQLGPQCAANWFWKADEDAVPPVVETETAYYFGDIKLYNRRELAAKLKRPELSREVSDLVLVSQYLDVFGDANIGNVNGDFVVGRLDRRSGHLRFFRDHFGVREFYYLAKPDITYFASAVPPLLRLPGAPNVPSLHALAAYLLLGAPMGDRTYFDEIRLLPPARYLGYRRPLCAGADTILASDTEPLCDRIITTRYRPRIQGTTGQCSGGKTFKQRPHGDHAVGRPRLVLNCRDCLQSPPKHEFSFRYDDASAGLPGCRNRRKIIC